MKTILFLSLSFLVFISAVQSVAQPAPAESIARGKYLVEHVAMCVECHTPRGPNGNLDFGRYLQGAPVPVGAPSYPNMKWAVRAPAIAGLIGYSKEQGITLLMDGITSDNRVPNPPMPPFRFTRSDAEAVVDYLKSLQ